MMMNVVVPPPHPIPTLKFRISLTEGIRPVFDDPTLLVLKHQQPTTIPPPTLLPVKIIDNKSAACPLAKVVKKNTHASILKKLRLIKQKNKELVTIQTITRKRASDVNLSRPNGEKIRKISSSSIPTQVREDTKQSVSIQTQVREDTKKSVVPASLVRDALTAANQYKLKKQQDALQLLRKQRDEERKAARLALKEVERSADVYDNFQVWKDLELLLGCSSDRLPNQLDKLGLRLKADDYMEEDDDPLMDIEEGEIVC